LRGGGFTYCRRKVKKVAREREWNNVSSPGGRIIIKSYTIQVEGDR
jgi:hypothetical protein